MYSLIMEMYKKYFNSFLDIDKNYKFKYALY